MVRSSEFPCTSAENRLAAPEPSWGIITAKMMIVPIPPSHWLTSCHSKRLEGYGAPSRTELTPVVVNAAALSNKAFGTEKSPEAIYGTAPKILA